jgi:DNA-nicking Smr family endonuclease
VTRKPRELSSDEKRLWRRVAEGVKSRRALPALDDEAAEAPLITTLTKRAEPPAAKPSAPKKSAPSPADRGSERRVRRGQVEIEARLDLHGYTQDAASASLHAFLQNAQRRGARTVLVITGYGRGGEGVLKKNLPGWIARAPLRSIVSGYAAAHRTHGGAGAVYVFLKRK